MNPNPNQTSKSIRQDQDMKILGECIASNDIISELEREFKSIQTNGNIESEEYKKGLLLGGLINFQTTNSVCKKQSGQELKSQSKSLENVGKVKSGKCGFIDKARKNIETLSKQNELTTKEQGQLKTVRLTNNHKYAFQSTIDMMTDLKKEYKCNNE